MERLTSNKPVNEMSMLELAYNSCYVENGKAMYRDFLASKDSRSFARELYKNYIGEDLSMIDDEFDEEMLDELQQDATKSVRGLIALFYRNLWAMAELRETLKTYEDEHEQGLLVELPCKVGSTVYRICSAKGRKYVASRSVWNLTYRLNHKGKVVWEIFTTTTDVLGETVFLTQEEAEEALAKMGE